MPHNLHNTLQSFKHGKFYSLPALGKALNVNVERLPVSIRIVLESVLRNCDGKKVTEEHVRELANWKPAAQRSAEILGRIPAGRWGTPDDFKGPTIFLASEAGNYVHGTILTVDGGWMGR